MPDFQEKLAPEQSELGKRTAYDPHYNPDYLFPISRKGKRDEINVPEKLPFFGCDIWNHYEVSWLNEKGKPVAAIARIIYNCDTPNIIESKSMKLYFNSFNNTKFKDAAVVAATIETDIEKRIGGPVSVNIDTLPLISSENIYPHFEGECLDKLDIECSVYTVQPAFLTVENEMVEETLYSDLLKSNCLVTNQPDWGSVQISYQGNKINHAGLLQYIVSFRNHNEFHEQCIERIFMDIMQYCQPKLLTVYGRYTRRGGVDINPIRSTMDMRQIFNHHRLYRQ